MKTTLLKKNQFPFNIALPEETKSYKPVGHYEVAKTVIEQVEKGGYTINNVTARGNREGLQAYGQIRMSNGGSDDFGRMIAWSNSYDKSLAVTFTCGAETLVCSNGMIAFRESFQVVRKHTGEVKKQLVEKVGLTLEKLEENYGIIKLNVDAMKKVTLTENNIAHLLGELYFEKRAIASSHLNIVKNELEKPSYDYGVQTDNLWFVYNCITLALKKLSAANTMKAHVGVHEHIVQQFCTK